MVRRFLILLIAFSITGCAAQLGNQVPNSEAPAAHALQLSSTSATPSSVGEQQLQNAQRRKIPFVVPVGETISVAPPPPKSSDPYGAGAWISTGQNFPPTKSMLTALLTAAGRSGERRDVQSGGSDCQQNNGKECHGNDGPYYYNSALMNKAGSNAQYPLEGCSEMGINTSYQWPVAGNSNSASVLYAPTFYFDVYVPIGNGMYNRNDDEITTAYFYKQTVEVGVVAKGQYITMNAANAAKYIRNWNNGQSDPASGPAYTACVLQKSDGLWHTQIYDFNTGVYDDVASPDSGDNESQPTLGNDYGWDYFEYYLPTNATCPVLNFHPFSDAANLIVQYKGGSVSYTSAIGLDSTFAQTFIGHGGCDPAQYQVTYPSTNGSTTYYSPWITK